MTVRFLIGDKSGRILAELEPDIGPISWRLNAVGQVNFSLAVTDPKAIQENLQFGNRVLLEFDSNLDLPAWGGIIDTPREWNLGKITCTAYSMEHILGKRTTAKNRTFTSATLGEIFQALLEDANAEEPTGIELGSIWTGGESFQAEYHLANVLGAIQSDLTAKFGAAEFDVTAAESSGRIVFTANFYQRKGSVLSNYMLIEGQNINITRLSVQGPLVNWIDVAGAGNDWGAARLVGNAFDATSRATYGLSQASLVANDLTDQAALDAYAANELAQNKDPHNIFELAAMNEKPSTFADYGVGDSLRLLAHSVGFGGVDTTVRILGREYDPRSGLCGLVVREET